jgi:hypothetical protein
MKNLVEQIHLVITNYCTCMYVPPFDLGHYYTTLLYLSEYQVQRQTAKPRFSQDSTNYPAEMTYEIEANISQERKFMSIMAESLLAFQQPKSYMALQGMTV